MNSAKEREKLKKDKYAQHCKEIKSFRKQVGKHIVWFESLSKKKQLDVLFHWKKYKRGAKGTLHKPSLKKMIYKLKGTRAYSVPVSLLRNNSIEILLK